MSRAQLPIYASFALGVMVTLVGVVLLVAPKTAAALYGLPESQGDPVWQHVAGLRELTAGVLILALAASGQRRALGYLMLALAPIPIGDFVLAVQHDAGLIAFQHAPGGPGMIVLGVVLLRQAQRA